eukprot:15458456-Alexandrium_andersonii.AAC.1
MADLRSMLSMKPRESAGLPGIWEREALPDSGEHFSMTPSTRCRGRRCWEAPRLDKREHG